MLIGVPKEILPGENRVALIPSFISTLTQAGQEVMVESGAGAGCFYADKAYEEAGASIAPNAEALYSSADIVFKIRPPESAEVEMLREGTTLICLMDAFFRLDLLEQLASQKISGFGLEFVPRISRAQSMDVLSSMAAIAGYRAVIEAAELLPKYFPMLMTSAGTIAPAKVFVIGAGVAGLMAIATAKRLGAVVEAYDTRPVVKEQVESVGAKFVEFDLETAGEDAGGYAKAQSDDFYKKQQEQMKAKVATVDVVITTAAIPGKKSPVLITDDMLQSMQAGSVIIDLAAERGGNTEGAEAGVVVEKHGIKIVGYTDYPSRSAVHASQLFAKNITTFLLNMVKDGEYAIDLEDEIVKGALLVHDGQVVHEMIKPLMEQQGE